MNFILNLNLQSVQTRIHQLMRKYCAEATKFGNAPQPMYTRFKTVLVIVNPMADKRSGLEKVST